MTAGDSANCSPDGSFTTASSRDADRRRRCKWLAWRLFHHRLIARCDRPLYRITEPEEADHFRKPPTFHDLARRWSLRKSSPARPLHHHMLCDPAVALSTALLVPKKETISANLRLSTTSPADSSHVSHHWPVGPSTTPAPPRPGPSLYCLVGPEEPDHLHNAATAGILTCRWQLCELPPTDGSPTAPAPSALGRSFYSLVGIYRSSAFASPHWRLETISISTAWPGHWHDSRHWVRRCLYRARRGRTCIAPG